MRRYPGIGLSQKQPGTVQMEAYPALASERGDALYLGKVEDFADNPTHRGFDRNHSHRRGDATFLGPRDLSRDLGQSES